MNLSFSGVAFILGIIIGGFVVYKFIPEPEPKIITLTKTDVKTKIVKVTKPSGEVIETTEQEVSENKSLKQDPTILKNYAIALGLDNAGARARLGKLPLFLEGGYNWKRNTFETRLSYEF